MVGEWCGQGGSCGLELSAELFKGEFVRVFYSAVCSTLSKMILTLSGVFSLYGGTVDYSQSILKVFWMWIRLVRDLKTLSLEATGIHELQQRLV